MDNKNTKVLEALRMQPLSEEEKTARHILGRMYGPIATCKESTRNGRLYNKPLWEKALVDDVFLEKVATKALFLELGHPADREETDMSKICACIPEVPKIVDGDLYAYVDILDTPNGKILKTLTDYGFVPGISSRGSGDIMPNDEVDPETFFLETWDIVQLPAVKKARLSMCESLSSSNKSLKSALVESMQGVEERDRMIMKEALDNLEIDVTEETLEEDELLPGGTPVNPDEIPFEDDILTEEADDEVDVEVTEEPTEVEETEEVEESTEDPDEVTEEPVADTETFEDEASETEEDSEIEDETVDDFIQALADEFDEEALLKLELVDIEGNEIEVADVDLVTDTNEDGDEVAKIVITGGETTDNEIDDEDQDEAEDTEIIEEIPEDVEAEAEENAEADEEISDEEVEKTEETADDDGELEVIESLKEMIRQKDSLSKEVKNLQTQKAVGDAKVKALEEELARYKEALARVSPIATKATKMEKENKKLSEQLDTQSKLVEQLTAQQKESTQLTESVDNSKKQIKDLTAKLEDAEKTEKALREQIQNTGRKFEERTKIAKSYKAKYLETLRCYVDSKAAMLGVPASEITTKLGESYTPTDIDRVCDQILESAVPMTRLPFSGKTRGSARITESAKPKATTAPEYGYEIDDDLLVLAGLK